MGFSAQGAGLCKVSRPVWELRREAFKTRESFSRVGRCNGNGNTVQPAGRERERDELRNLLFLLSAEPETKCSGRYILEMDAF